MAQTPGTLDSPDRGEDEAARRASPSATDASGTSPSTAAPKHRTKESRQRLIADYIVKQGSCSPLDLASEFDVSLMTVHRDLDNLERQGIVRKFHGGVTAQPSGVFESQLSYRRLSQANEKRAIAQLALRYVQPGMSVMLDDSTTTLQMVPGLAERAPLHVATPFLEGLQQLTKAAIDADLTVIALGGVYDLPHDSFVGMQCIEQIQGIRADALFVSTSAVSSTYAFHQEERIVALKRAMIDAATKRYLLVDHSKIGNVALHRVAQLQAFDLILTDAEADPAALAAWAAAGIDYEVAQP